MPGTYSHTTRADGSILTGSIYNQDHQQHVTFNTPGGCDDYSTNVGQMQSTVDPGEVGSESLPTDLAGELQRIRKILTEITGKTYWYESPGGSLESSVVGLPSVNRLVGARHATTTQYTLSSVDRVCLIHATGGPNIIRTLPGTLTVDATVAGPAANGRDQAGAFTNPSWVHLYYIWNGTLLRLIASTAVPTTGPALPSGYTHYAYATTILFTTLFAETAVMGNKVYNNLAGFSALTSASVVTIGSLASIVPPLATHAFGSCSVSGTTTAGGAIDMILELDAASASPLFSAATVRLYANGLTGATAQVKADSNFLSPLLTAQTVYYSLTVSVGTSGAAVVKVQGYVVPNGDVG